MKLLLEFNGRHRKVRRGRKVDILRVVMIVVALHILVLGGIFIFEAAFTLDPMPGVSADDDNIIRSHFHEVSPPPSVGVRLHNALQVLKADSSAAQPPAVVVTMLAIGPCGILVGTQSNGVHIYDRQMKSWQIATDDDSSAVSTNTPAEDTTDDHPSEDPVIVPPRASPSKLVAQASWVSRCR